MPLANRHFLPGYVWHITHRCHRKSFLLKFARDRQSYLRWVFEAKKRFGLSVLNYIVTANHVHLLVRDTGANVIANSMQLIAGRTGQEYNQRKGRHGAFWEDRYHATAIEADDHLHRCRAPTAGLEAVPKFLTVDWLLSQFAQQKPSSSSVPTVCARRFG